MNEDKANSTLRKELDVIVDLLKNIQPIIFEYIKQGGKHAEIAVETLRYIVKLVNEIESKKDMIDEYVQLSNSLGVTLETLDYILSIAQIPGAVGAGKRLIESVAGFRGLGIEPIDHRLRDVGYENIAILRPEDIFTDISMTNFIYRTPPFEVVRSAYEEEAERKITEILGPRFVWLIKPHNVTDASWSDTVRKVGRSVRDPLIRGSYNRFSSLVIPASIELIDLSARSITIEIAEKSRQFFLKLGSSRLERLLQGTINRHHYLEELIKIASSEDLVKNVGPWRLRLDYVYFCYKGRGLSTDPFDKNECPFIRNCRLGGLCKNNYWSGRYGQRKYYPKVYPLRRILIRKGGQPKLERKLPKSLIIFEAYDRKRVEPRWYAIEMGTWFIPDQPITRIFFENEIGYSIATSAIVILFNNSWLEDVIRDILASNHEVRKHLALKYIMHKRTGKRLDFKKIAKVLDSIIKDGNVIYDEYRRLTTEFTKENIDQGFINFAKRVLLHTFEHFITQYMLKSIVGVDLSFVLTKYLFRNDRAGIIIAENAKNGGLGVVDTIVRVIKSGGLSKFIYDFITWSMNYIENHNDKLAKQEAVRLNEAQQKLAKAINGFKQSSDPDKRSTASKLERIIDVTIKFADTLRRSNVELDLTLTRIALLFLNKNIDIEGIEEYFDDVLESQRFGLCTDGCNACVRLERYCNEGFEQILTTSKILFYEFLRYLRDEIFYRGITVMETNVGRYVEPVIFGAKTSLDIICPYISPNYAERLVKMASEGVAIRVLTWAPERASGEFEYQKKALDILLEGCSKNRNLQVRVSQATFVHVKTYIIDNDVVITGSLNLTERAFKENVERVEIGLHPDTIKHEREQFENLWNTAIDLRNVFSKDAP